MVKCLDCLEVIQSVSQHDFKSCKCGNTAIDGGIQGGRILGNHFSDLGRWTTEGPEKALHLPEGYWDSRRAAAAKAATPEARAAAAETAAAADNLFARALAKAGRPTPPAPSAAETAVNGLSNIARF